MMLLASISAVNGLHLARLGLLFGKVVVSGEHTPRATRGSWLFRGDDPGKDQCPGCSFYTVSSVKT